MKQEMHMSFIAGILLLFTNMTPPHSSPDFNQAPKKEVLVAAAADLKFAMDSLIAEFSKEYPGIPIKVTYGSSGNFFEQISNGAPFDLFFSADIDFPRKLAAQNKTISPVTSYGKGEIVLWSKKLDPAKDKMNTLLSNSIIKIAIANPVHAPYGKRAEESLIHYKIYDKIKNKLVIGENISQTALFVTSGAADIGIVALSLALSPAMKQAGGKYWLIPAETHQPLEQGYVILQHAQGNAGAVSFSGFIRSPKAIAIMKYFGYGY
jgi:molybdate transport system substrate-binding protein